MPSSVLSPLPFAPASRFRSSRPPSREQVTAELARLRSLPFAHFARTIVHLLTRLGYEEVTLCGVPHGRGRNQHGGLDIQARSSVGLTRSQVICQLRQYAALPVTRLNVDVLRGAMLRMGATQGLLFTTSSFSRAALEAAQAAQHLAPVRLIDGEELAALLLTSGREAPQATPQRIPARSPRPAGSAALPTQRPPKSAAPGDSSPIPQPSRATLQVCVTLTAAGGRGVPPAQPHSL